MADFPHFFLRDSRTLGSYTSTGAGGGSHQSPPRPERTTHAEKLLSDLELAEKSAKSRQQTEPIREGLQFIPMRFAEGSEFHLELERLENERQGIRIISARRRGGKVRYMVAVPDRQVASFVKRFTAYRDVPTMPRRTRSWRKAFKRSSRSSSRTIGWTRTSGSLLMTKCSGGKSWLINEGKGEVANAFRAVAGNQRIQVSEERPLS